MNALSMRRTSCAALLFVWFAQAGAQGLNAADVSEWSAFVPRAVEPERSGPVLDLVFQDVRRDGPWSRQSEGALLDAERTLLRLLTQQQWAPALNWLKQHQPDLNRKDESGVTPLTMAVRGGQLDLVREMIRQGADLDQVGTGGMTPLGQAAFNGEDIIARDLLHAGARVDAVGATGQMPLHLACATGQTRLVSTLIKSGADWRAFNRQGRHAVAEAALFGQVSVLQQLMQLKDLGVDLNAPDRHQLNALHAAALGQQMATVDWLRERGATVPSAITQIMIEQLQMPMVPGN